MLTNLRPLALPEEHGDTEGVRHGLLLDVRKSQLEGNLGLKVVISHINQQDLRSLKVERLDMG